MKKKTSKVLCVSVILATVYTIYLISYFSSSIAGSEDLASGVGAAIASALVAPHMFMFLIGAVFGWIAVFTKKTWAALVAAILYSVAAVLFLLYIMFALPILILGFVGYAKQKKINKLYEEVANL